MSDFTASFILIDAVEHQKQHPKTFELPDEINRQNIRVGEWAKLMFIFPANRYSKVERMRVRITEVKPTGYKGVLDNDPENIEFIRYGESVAFEARHVISIYPPRMYLGPLTLEENDSES